MIELNGTPRKRTSQRPRLLGYARVSSNEQNLNLQLDALKKKGCRKPNIFVDKVSGAKAKRPGLDNCLAQLEDGDVLVLWRLDRLGRSMPYLVTLVEELKERGVGFRSICDGVIDTTTASGEPVFNIFFSLAQFERRLIQERTRVGLAAARAPGRKGGRKAIENDAPKVVMAKTMHQDKKMDVGEICQTLGISRTTFAGTWRWVIESTCLSQ